MNIEDLIFTRAEINVPACVASTHVPPVIADPLRLHWKPCDGMPIRVEEHTCNTCRTVSYEYGLVGGAYRIRRTDRRKGRPVFHDTPPVPRTTAERWWRGLLAGEAL